MTLIERLRSGVYGINRIEMDKEAADRIEMLEQIEANHDIQGNDEMTPLLTDEEIERLQENFWPCYTSSARDFARAIEQAVMKRAYQRAAEVCDGNTLRSTKFYGEYEEGVDAAAKHCRDAILKLMD